MALNDIKVPKENAQGTFNEIALAASDLKLGTTANLPLRTGSGGVIEAGSFGTAAGSFCEGNDARLSDDRDPNLHAASHLAGTPAVAASYTGIGDNGTFSEEVTITANTAGTAGNNITLTFDGVDDVDTVLAAWNSANPSNQATLVSGDGAQVPDNGDELTLSGGAAAIAGGSDPFANINQDLGTTNSVQFAGLELNSPSNGEILRIEGNGSGDVGFAVYNNAGDQSNSFYFNQNNSFIGIGVGASRNYIQSSQPVDVGAELAVAGPIDITGASASTHKATTRTNLGAAASGSITTSGLTQATARILGRTSASAGSIEEIQIGSGLSLSAGELSSTVSAGIPATLLDAKGDLIVASAADTAARLAVGGTNGHVLTVDSAETLGVKWAAAAGGVGGGTGSTDNSILRSDGTGGSTLQDSALVIDDATTSTQANVALKNNHSETNSSLVWTGKGTGALIWGPKPDGTSTGGNARGSRAVDLQPTRDSAARIASGTNSFAIGHSNLASGTRSFAGGTSCTASGESAFAFGDNSSCSGAYGGIACGDGCSTTAVASASFGFSNASSGNYSFSCGFDNTASGANGSFAHGQQALANRTGLYAYANGRFAADGDAQNIRTVLRGSTTTNSAVELLMSGASVRLTIASGRAMFINAMIVGISNGGGTVATFQRQYAIKNIGGTTSEIYAPVTIGTDNAASTSISLTADDTNDSVKFECTGLSATTIRWVAYVSAVEVAHG
jgi:hypothetical protein